MRILRKIGPIIDNYISDLLGEFVNKDGDHFNLGWGDLEQEMLHFDASQIDFPKNIINHYDNSYGLDDVVLEVRKFINKFSNFKVNKEDIIITNGGTNALFLLGYYFHEFKGMNEVAVQEPTYDTALNIFRSQHIKPKPVSIDFGNIVGKKFDLVYGMCKLHNPTGFTLDANAAGRIKKNILRGGYFIDDDAYGLLLRNGTIDLIKHNRYIYVGSFSKYIFPGLRMGYIIANKKIIDTLKIVQKYVNSHPNVLSQYVLLDYLRGNKIYKEIEVKRRLIINKRMVFEEGLSDKAKSLIAYRTGGFYYWFNLPNKVKWGKMYLDILKNNIFLMPSEVYYCSRNKKGFRACVSSMPINKLKNSAIILSNIIAKYV